MDIIVNASKALGIAHTGVLKLADGSGALYIPACAVPAFPTEDEAWSLSADCVNRGFVTDSAQEIVGWNTPLQKIFCVFILLPVGGVIADNYGRRVMLAFYTLCCITAAFLFMLDTSLHATWGNWAVYTGASLLAASWEPKDSAIIGSVADLLGSDEANKARALSALYMFNSVGTFVGFCAAYATLQMHLANYFTPWLCFTLVGCGVMLIVHFWVIETLPERHKKPITKEMLNPITSQIISLKILCRDRVLMLMAAAMFWWYFHWVRPERLRCCRALLTLLVLRLFTNPLCLLLMLLDRWVTS